MAKQVDKLSAVRVARIKRQGWYGDGNGLWLQVTAAGVKSWLFRYTRNGKARAMGLGPVHTVSLSEARDKAREARALLQDDKDPIDEKRAAKAAKRRQAASVLTFNECTERYIGAHKAGWRNEKHAGQWRSTLDTYAGPVIGETPVRDIDMAMVLRVLEPIWTTKPETASRLRGRIERVLDWAKPRGYREGENAARWKGNLETQLPNRAKVARVTHHPALPYSELPGLMAKIKKIDSVAARALEFTILTTARTSEVLGATWDEISLDAKEWTIPGERMKAGRSHRVPLTARAVKILEKLPRVNAYVFPGVRQNKPLSNGTMMKILKESLGRPDLTVHGFRSTFRDWCAEQTNYPRELAEAALAHVVKDKTERAYQRGDLFEKRRRLMDAWAKYAETVSRTVDSPVRTLCMLQPLPDNLGSRNV